MLIWTLVNTGRLRSQGNLLFLIVIVLYSLVVGLFSRFNRFDFIFTGHYVLLFGFIFFLINVQRFNKDLLLVTIKGLFWVVLLLIPLELLTGFELPNTNDRPNELVAFFWNGNESSSFMVVSSYVLYRDSVKRILGIFYISVALLFSIYNSARLCIAGEVMLIVFLISGWLVQVLVREKYYGFGKRLMAVLCAVLLSFLIPSNVWLFLGNIFAVFVEGNILYNLGSISNRLNAVMLGIRELAKSGFLGIGAGNSVIFMEEIIVPGTERFTAYSMHNPVLQFIVEFGVFAGVLLMYAYRKLKRRFKVTYGMDNLIFRIGFFVLISSITSGFHSNYALILSIYVLLISYDRKASRKYYPAGL